MSVGNQFISVSFSICIFFVAEIPESSCPCENDVFDVTVDVDPAKSPMTKELVLDVFQNVYTSASTFMKKQGMDLKS